MRGVVLFFSCVLAGAPLAHADLRDALEGRALRRQLDEPANYPSFVKSTEWGTRIGHYLIGGKKPTGEVACRHIRVVEKKNDAPVRWEDRNTAASNVFYHIHRAIGFFDGLSSQVRETIDHETRPVTVRLDMD